MTSYDEVTETLTATLSNPQGSADNPAPTISTATAAVTITDNDATSLAISAAPLTIAEGAVPNTITFTVTRTGNAEGNQSVAYALTGVDASDLTGASDPLTGTLTFATGETRPKTNHRLCRR